MSTKQILRSSTVSPPLLLLLRSTFTSSASDHQLGNGLVLANTSVILDVLSTTGGSFLAVLLLLLGFLLCALCALDAAMGVLENASTCTMSGEDWTIDFMSEVLPVPREGVSVRSLLRTGLGRHTRISSNHYLQTSHVLSFFCKWLPGWHCYARHHELRTAIRWD